ncbi:hypothetical protein K466DRAFT_668560 [Polyporus arcularius HHB13444]|uniref:Protein kinase domain-containing protein n=1 Tax=Polyporus arcularius HHB13444 TaxID=1314778 RepID=A0A5C3NLW3_9APHY|nr:hypothetical protein K466DRAFT_668560 [Polyporus arcularius HHB13444]
MTEASITLHWPQYASSLSELSSGQIDSDNTWYYLDSFIPPSDVPQVVTPIRAFVDTLIREKPDGNTQVFRAALRPVHKDGTSPNERRVVCKVAYGGRRVDALKAEARIYTEKLRHLQGMVVPTIYGCYVGKTNEGHTGILVLQDVGDSLKASLRYYDLALRKQVVLALHLIHKAGVVHNDFKERNLVVRMNKDLGVPTVMVVDFGNASDHVCPIQGDMIRFYIPKPDRLVFKCQELYVVCAERAEVWRPAILDYCGKPVPSTWAIDGPEELVRKAKAQMGIDPADPEEAKRSAEEACQSLWRRVHERNYWDANPQVQSWPDTI